MDQSQEVKVFKKRRSRWFPSAPKPATFNPDASDADNDGRVQEGTTQERPGGAKPAKLVRGNTPKKPKSGNLPPRKRAASAPKSQVEKKPKPLPEKPPTSGPKKKRNIIRPADSGPKPKESVLPPRKRTGNANQLVVEKPEPQVPVVDPKPVKKIKINTDPNSRSAAPKRRTTIPKDPKSLPPIYGYDGVTPRVASLDDDTIPDNSLLSESKEKVVKANALVASLQSSEYSPEAFSDALTEISKLRNEAQVKENEIADSLRYDYRKKSPSEIRRNQKEYIANRYLSDNLYLVERNLTARIQAEDNLLNATTLADSIESGNLTMDEIDTTRGSLSWAISDSKDAFRRLGIEIDQEKYDRLEKVHASAVDQVDSLLDKIKESEKIERQDDDIDSIQDKINSLLLEMNTVDESTYEDFLSKVKEIRSDIEDRLKVVDEGIQSNPYPFKLVSPTEEDVENYAKWGNQKLQLGKLEKTLKGVSSQAERFEQVQKLKRILPSYVSSQPFTFAELEDEKVKKVGFADSQLDAAGRLSGFAGDPVRMDSIEEMEEMAESGDYILISRNIWSSRKGHEALRDGDYETGNGIYGNGFYFGHSSTTNGYGDYRVYALMPRGINTITWDDLLRRYRADTAGQQESGWNTSIYAIQQGFDAIWIPDYDQHGIYNVLNRTAMIISPIYDGDEAKRNYTPKWNKP